MCMSHRETDSKVCLRTPLRVLIYNSLGIQDDLASTISSLGYLVETQQDRKEALSQLEQRDFPVHLIRTDDQGTGLDFMVGVRLPRTTAFIAITNCAACESAVLSLRAGMRDYIVWPSTREELCHALSRVFEEVEQARFREDMLSMLTHDIKIPLSSILGYSSLVFDRETGELHERARDYVKIINSSGLKILALIDNFLTTNKIDSGKLHLCLEDLDLTEFLEEIAETFQTELDRHNLKLEVDVAPGLPPVEVDEGLLFRAVGNLLANACKFSPENTTVYMTALPHGINRDGEIVDGVTINVTNEGPGIGACDIPEIFDRFRRGQAQESIEGSGLGGYVVKSIAEAHGGFVNVESAPNRLTTFSICLPLKVL